MILRRGLLAVGATVVEEFGHGDAGVGGAESRLAGRGSQDRRIAGDGGVDSGRAVCAGGDVAGLDHLVQDLGVGQQIGPHPATEIPAGQIGSPGQAQRDDREGERGQADPVAAQQG